MHIMGNMLQSISSVRNQVAQWINSNRWVSIDSFFLHVVLITSVLIMSLPLIFAGIMSTQSLAEIYDIYYIIPGSTGLENYQELFFERGMIQFYINTIIMSIVIVVGKVVLSLLAALAIVFYDFKYKKLAFFFILFTLMMPVQVRVVPLFEVITNLGWYDSMWAITIPYLASATATFLFYQHFRSISTSIVENAKMDGISGLKFLIFVLIPMSKGMIAGVAVITFITAWNQYLWPLVAIASEDQQVVQVALKFLQGQAQEGMIEWNLIMAGAISAVVPPLIVLILFRKQLLETFGVK